MNRYARDMIMRRRDMKNPYGSRGGYVSSDRASRGSRSGYVLNGRRDNAMNDYARQGSRDYNMDNARYGRDRASDYAGRRNDYARYSSDRDYRDYADYGRSDMDYEQRREYDRDYEYMSDGHYGKKYYPVEAMGTFSGYYGMEEDYADRDYNDYAEEGEKELSTKDIKKWEKELKNADGTKGKKFETEQIKAVAQQAGIKFQEYRPETMAVIVNMLYSDYCKVLGNDLMIYIKLAKAFLEDDDFEGEPEEKAMLYYKCIVSKDEE